MKFNEAWVAQHMNKFKKPDPDAPEKADQGPESVLQGKINKWCNEHGFPKHSFRRSKKAKGFIDPGMPDICIFISGGRTVHIELKSESGVLRKAQRDKKAMLEWNGHKVWVVKSYNRFLDIMNEYLK